MTYVVAEPCVNCRYTDCALVCPVEAFHLDDDMLVINPETCIDCDACVPECPVEAVFAGDKVPAEWAQFTQINADRALSGLRRTVQSFILFIKTLWPNRSWAKS